MWETAIKTQKIGAKDSLIKATPIEKVKPSGDIRLRYIPFLISETLYTELIKRFPLVEYMRRIVFINPAQAITDAYSITDS